MVTEHEPNILVTKFIGHSVNISNRGLLFSIFSGDPHHHFYLNPNSGELYTTYVFRFIDCVKQTSIAFIAIKWILIVEEIIYNSSLDIFS